MSRNDLVALIGISVLFGYGLFFAVWPDKARGQFLAQYDLDSPTKTFNPSTWLKFRPGPLAFRIIGILSVSLSLFLVYFWNSRRHCLRVWSKFGYW